MAERLVENQADFQALCNEIRERGLVAFDTEFVSEYTYRPDLGLLQFAMDDRSVAVDPYAVSSLDCWWDVMTDDKTTVVVHGGQAEIRFCLQYVGRPPQKLVDVQIAEGLYSRSYPVGYATLASRVLDKTTHGKETRTDWRRRPLSRDQIHYALEDVEFVLPIWSRQREILSTLNRLDWAEAEFQRMIDSVQEDVAREGWERLAGLQKLTRRELAVVREIAA